MILSFFLCLPIPYQFYLTSHGGQLKKNMDDNDKGWVNWKVMKTAQLSHSPRTCILKKACMGSK